MSVTISGPEGTDYTIVPDRVMFAADLLDELHRRQWREKNLNRITKALVGEAMLWPRKAQQSFPHPHTDGVVQTAPFRWGCRVVRMQDGLWDVQYGNGAYLSSKYLWVRHPDLSCSTHGIFATEHDALSALLQSNEPPPLWKEETCSNGSTQHTKSKTGLGSFSLSPSSSVMSSVGGSGNRSSDASAKTDPQGIRLASEVAAEIRQWAWVSDGARSLIADRVATLYAWEKYKEGCFNSRDPRTYDGLQADFIAYLKGQTP